MSEGEGKSVFRVRGQIERWTRDDETGPFFFVKIDETDWVNVDFVDPN